MLKHFKLHDEKWLFFLNSIYLVDKSKGWDESISIADIELASTIPLT